MQKWRPGAVLAGVVWTGLQMLGGYIVDSKISGAGDVYGRPEDERALTLQAQQEEVLTSERVSVDFDRGPRPQRVEDTQSG